MQTLRLDCWDALTCWIIALRLNRVVPINQRATERNKFLPCGGGSKGESPIFVSGGTSVYVMVYDMHRRKDIFCGDAHDFRPERWAKLSPEWGSLPFGGGPWLCIGRELIVSDFGFQMTDQLRSFCSHGSNVYFGSHLAKFRCYRGCGQECTMEENLSVTLSTYSGCKVRLFQLLSSPRRYLVEDALSCRTGSQVFGFK